MLGLERLIDIAGVEVGAVVPNLGDLDPCLLDGPAPRQAGGQHDPGEQVTALAGHGISSVADGELVLSEQVVASARDAVIEVREGVPWGSSWRQVVNESRADSTSPEKRSASPMTKCASTALGAYRVNPVGGRVRNDWRRYSIRGETAPVSSVKRSRRSAWRFASGSDSGSSISAHAMLLATTSAPLSSQGRFRSCQTARSM